MSITKAIFLCMAILAALGGLVTWVARLPPTPTANISDDVNKQYRVVKLTDAPPGVRCFLMVTKRGTVFERLVCLNDDAPLGEE